MRPAPAFGRANSLPQIDRERIERRVLRKLRIGSLEPRNPFVERARQVAEIDTINRRPYASASVSRLARTFTTRRPSTSSTSNNHPPNTILSPTRGTRRSSASSSPASVW